MFTLIENIVVIKTFLLKLTFLVHYISELVNLTPNKNLFSPTVDVCTYSTQSGSNLNAFTIYGFVLIFPQQKDLS